MGEDIINILRKVYEEIANKYFALATLYGMNRIPGFCRGESEMPCVLQ